MINYIEINTGYNSSRDSIINSYVDKSNKTICGIPYISKVNICIGKNNSGKSRFIREVASNKEYEYYRIDKFEKSLFFQAINNYMNYINSHPRLVEIIDRINNKLDSNYDEMNIISEINSLVSQIEDEEQSDTLDGLKVELIKLIPKNGKKQNPFRVYIPTLRGIEKFKNTVETFKENDDNFKMNYGERKALESYINQIDQVYLKKVTKCYFPNILNRSSLFSIFTGEILYDDIQEKLLGDENNRQLIKKYEEFLSKNFFDNKSVSLIPNIKEKYLFINIDGEEYELHNVGEGIKQLIIITYEMFKRKSQETIFFIEELEINLHPGLQRKFMEIMLSDEFDKHQFFITTHSNHLIDLSLDYDNLSIFKFEKDDDRRMRVSHCQRIDKEILYLIGAKASSVYNSNCAIWVEGITDRLYLRKYLELYEQELMKKNDKLKYIKEDIDYSFVEYSGNNITHWNFFDVDENSGDKINAMFINNNIFLIADNDFPSSETKKERRLKQLSEKLGDRFYKLKCREIENLLTNEVLKKTVELREQVPITQIYEYKNESSKCRKEHIGEWIEKSFKRNDNSNMYKYTLGNSNALYNKLDFCKLAIQNITKYDDLSEEAKELTEKVYRFIEDNNNM